MLKSITYRRVVDLSHPIRPGIPLWPAGGLMALLPNRGRLNPTA